MSVATSSDLAPFQQTITEGIPDVLPPAQPLDPSVSHAPKRKDILSAEEKKLALRNALRYFPKKHHATLAPEFAQELKELGRIYMHRLRPTHKMHARPITDYPAKCKQAAAIMLMIQNNLDPAVAQHPHELITYGGNGAVFQNWAQYRLTMKYLSEMSNEQTLVMYSGHPLGLFPSHTDAPRVVVTNGMMIPNYSQPDDWEKFNALGVTQYGQMTAGSYMYIGPQGIVHGTTITVLNACRMLKGNDKTTRGKLFVTAGLGGMSGAQPKAGNIAGVVTICAEVNATAAHKRQSQGWVDEVIDDVDACIDAAINYQKKGEAHSIAFLGNVVDLWERMAERKIKVDLGSDQTSLHNPWAGGYYPVGLSYEESNALMAADPAAFKERVQETLRRHVKAVNTLAEYGMYFFDYGNAFLLESKRAGAEIEGKSGEEFRYPSYVEDIMGPMCFDHGFGPFRWVCTSGDAKDLATSDRIAGDVLEAMGKEAPKEIGQQIADNLHWIRSAQENKLVVGSQARILYADSEGRIRIAEAFNKAIKSGEISAPIVLGRDHHDVSGTDSPYRETSNIRDGSRFTADMAVQNFVGDAFRGATWISLHNGGGVGWGEVINGGFGMVLDGSADSDRRLKSMLHWDVNNGIARRAWARNPNAVWSIEQEMKRTPGLKVTLPNEAEDGLIDGAI
ncbi:MAG: urocanate hydratase [Flavobacteriales bacterium]|jgi:urocanate hydratase|nr:urocanate hydratase [Flavobacteriales bacterium]MBK6549739.1 urocanate hydratase [Flavobacteriales bacterium]MBK6883574.1 urocanate hydratase [Flavobacteriales bacterium]MBK7102255.1 urocanate hydratase [Flavobacteriales bacterium]MBK8533328.1 urocanate hydratase [Flavobacteriales bacterium]